MTGKSVIVLFYGTHQSWVFSDTIFLHAFFGFQKTLILDFLCVQMFLDFLELEFSPYCD